MPIANAMLHFLQVAGVSHCMPSVTFVGFQSI